VQEFLGLTVLGLCTASIFALAASGLVLTYTTTGIFNFAHGAVLMLGAFAYWQLHEDWGWPVPVALATVVLVLAPLLGLAIERGIMRHLTDAPETVRMVVTISLMLFLLGLAQWWWPPDEAHPTTLLFPGRSFEVFDIGVTYHRALGLVVAVLVAIGLRLLLHRTQAGLDMRAAVDSRSLALLHGARPDRSAALAWAIGCSLAAIAGILIAPTRTLSHVELTLLVVNAYAAAVFGRLRSLPLTFLGAVVLGLADSYAIGYIPTTNPWWTPFRFAIPSILLFVVLLALPSAQLRTRSVTASREEVPRPQWLSSLATAAAFIAVAVVLANVLSEVDALRASNIVGLSLIALSLVPLTGFAGQVSLCQMSFAAIGAIVMAHHGRAGQPAVLLLVALVCAGIGALVALPSLRLRGLYLALSTAAFAVFLTSWIFLLPAFSWGPLDVKVFDLGIIALKPLDLPFVDSSSRAAQLVILSVAFALQYLVVVAVRRSAFGERLLAIKDSPAAAATLGMNVSLVKIGVFMLSAAMAGVGGALYATTLGSVSPDLFALLPSLALLLLAVVGGIGTAGGALFAGIVVGGLPIIQDIWPSLNNVILLLPGTIGITMGRNPNGAVGDMARRFGVVREVPGLLGLVVAVDAIISGLAIADVITGWVMLIGLIASLLIATRAAELVVARRSPQEHGLDLEWAGIDRPFTDADLHLVDRGLGLEEEVLA
jgi:branched-chain amino acid transport system permease protein